ncbi:discoidin domain-containing protein [Streptomyces sp. NPDC006458]|uniref:discoidin domain-containing protein n=1 Tax=Streptomyces sp. NPDC006458 TaxID=3154302 RepID=UPI0033B2F972
MLVSALGLGVGERVAAAATKTAAPAGPIPYSYRPNVTVCATPLPDVAGGKPVRASSSVAGKDTPFNGNDGYELSKRAPANSQFPHWWQVDLEGYFDLSGTQIVWPSQGASYTYRIEASTDGTTWSTFVNRVDNATDTRIRQDTFAAQNVRFVRVTLLAVSGTNLVGFCDFQAFGKLRAGSDVALAKIAYASSGDQAANAIDGSDSTKWTADGLYWRVDLLAKHDLKGVEVTWAEDGVRYDYVVETSVDKSTWKTVVDRSANTSRSKVQSASFTESGVMYVRLRMIGVDDGHPARFSEFKVLATQTDVALKKPASASSNDSAAVRANDGDQASAWVAANGDPQWWMVDLGSLHDLNTIRTRWEADVAYRFTVEASADKQTWTKIVDRSSNTATSQPYSDTVTATGVRYVRVNFISAGGWWAGLRACEVLGRPSAMIDVALNKPASASSNDSVAARANDGDQQSIWIAANANPQWWMVDLGAPHDLNTIRTRWEANAAYRFTVEASADKQTWTKIVDRSTNTATSQPYSDTVTATGVRYVRVNFISAGGWWAGLRACEVLGRPSASNAALARPTYTNDTEAYANREKGNDGSESTSFEFLGYGDPYVYKVDLLQQFDISGIEIAWSTFGTRSPYRVEASPDNTQWTSLLPATTATSVNSNSVSAQKVRFVRVLVPSTHDSYKSGIQRLKVLGAPSAAVNLAAGRGVKKKRETNVLRWRVELAGLAKLESIQIDWQDPSIVGEYTVDVSSDSQTWVPAVKFSGPAAQSEASRRLRAHQVRFVRVTAPIPSGTAVEPGLVSLAVTGTMMRDESILDLEARKSFDYFWELANTDQNSGGFGLITERTGRPEPTSTSGTGFGLAALVIGADRGWVTREAAYDRALGTLNTLLSLEHRFGVLYHYYNRDDGTVYYWDDAGRSEVGLIDTQLMLNGVIVAGEYFGGEVKTKADELYRRVDWASFRDAQTNLYHMSYFDETDEFKYFWSWSSEAKLMYVLGAGSPTHPVPPEMFYAFERHEGTYGETYPSLINTWFGSLFTYQFAEIFADFRNSKDSQGVDWWRNAVLATKTHKEYATREDANFRTFGPDMWGMSASMTPSGQYSSAVGAPPSGYSNTSHENDGTVSPDGAGGSLAMDPQSVTRVLDNCYYNYPEAWGTYGFLNALNFDWQPAWVSDEEFALDKGAALVSIENHRSGLLWRLFMQNSYVLDGLKKVGIVYAPNSTPLDVAIAAAQIVLDRVTAANPSAPAVGQLSAAIRTAQKARLDATTQEEVTEAAAVLKAATDGVVE